MASTIDVAFIEEYNADVHLAFQQMGSRLTNLTRKGRVAGDTVYWQKFGTLAAQGKTRNAIHSFLDPEHTRVSATMADRYVPTLVDKLDLLKLNIDERRAHAMSQVAALGRDADSIIITAMDAGANATQLGDAAKAWTYDTFMSVVTTFQVNEVPDDNRRFCGMHPYAWAQALQVNEFANADYVGPAQLPFAGGMTMKNWMGVNWFVLPNVDLTTNIAKNLAWHQSAVGHGINSEIETTWDWENDRSAYSCVSSMSIGSAVIDDNGMYEVLSLSPVPAP